MMGKISKERGASTFINRIEDGKLNIYTK